MKISNLLSVAAMTFFAGQAQADIIPAIDEGSASCHAWADQLISNPVYYKAAKERCESFDRCMADHSVNHAELRECAYRVEAKFAQATVASSGGGRDDVGVMDAAVETEAPDSDYLHPEREKGFEFSKQGD
ncbi:MAG: hypothetical protein JSR85_07775 [Proteobacteria bacterium]|nr:hypothetical protein [Pseudomonadota bacterium]